MISFRQLLPQTDKIHFYFEHNNMRIKPPRWLVLQSTSKLLFLAQPMSCWAAVTSPSPIASVPNPQDAQGELRGNDVCERLQGFWMGAPGTAFLMTGDFSSDLNGPDFSTESTENN